jgi:ribosomal 50S subunit-recycling heat shock protein
VRLDKYLKLTRLIKRRTVAKEAADQGHVVVNGRPAKPGHEVRAGDRIEIHLGGRVVEVEVLLADDAMRPKDAPASFRVLSDRRLAADGEGGALED